MNYSTGTIFENDLYDTKQLREINNTNPLVKYKG